MHLLSLIAQDSDGDGSGGAAIVQLGILLLIPLALYFLMIRPQRRRMREQAALQAGLDVGDEIVTTAGIYGFITGFDRDDRVWVEIDDDVQVRIARAAIANKVDTSGSAVTPEPAPPAEQRPESSDTSSDATNE
jgi:preprotein translocase subunit YajC